MLFTLLFFALMTGEVGRTTAVEPTAAYKSMACDFFGPDNAAKLLGTKFRGEDGGMSEDSEGRKWKCTFMRTGDVAEKSPKIHFMIISSPSIDVSKQVFNGVRTSNQKLPGWQEWPGVGDEAIVHSDVPNFYLIMVRSGTKTIRIKANPAAGVSLDESKNIAVALAATLARQ